jgi:hypothetical protein
MRLATSGPVTPLLGSLGLHGGIALTLLLAVRHPAPIPQLPADAWTGNAVEVDAVASPEAPNMPSTASSPANAEPETSERAPAPAEPAITEPVKSAAPDHAAPEHAAPEHAAPRAKTATPRPRSTPSKPTSNADPASAQARAAEASGSNSASTPASGAFGAEGLPPGVRSLPSAFTRAIPPATAADPLWQTLPVGSEHPFTIAVEVDADGHVSSAEILKERDGSLPPIQAVHLRERVVALLGGGLFALQNGGAGRELFRITITLSDQPVSDEDAPAQVVQRGFEPPRGSTPGRAYFTLASGRHLEAKVQVLPRP